MNKRLILILALAFAVGISCAAYAEVQNVKVSGDINIMGVARNNFDLVKPPVMGSGHTNDLLTSKEADLLSITRVRIDADLTDNVSTTVRLINERNWNGESRNVGYANANLGNGSGTANLMGATGTANTSAEGNIDLDLAYVTLKEFLYSPLTLRIGRQELRFGNGLIVGDPDTNQWSSRTALAEGDLSARKAFDAIRATFDYNPLVVDLIYAKISEGNVLKNDDVNLLGGNANYALTKNTTLEGFLFSKIKQTSYPSVFNIDAGNATSFVGATAGTTPSKSVADQVNAVGARVVDKTIKNLNVDAQVAYQFGTYNPAFDPNARFITTTNKKETSERSAWAAQVMANYDLKDIKAISKWKPSIGAGYTYLSGTNREKTGSGAAYQGWDPMFEDQTIGHIMNAILADTNMHKGNLSANAKITDDIGLKVDYVAAWFAKAYTDQRKAVLAGDAGSSATGTARVFRMGKSAYIGQEIDAKLTYDYTEDVQFGLLGGIMLVGKNINANLDNTDNIRAPATELIGSMKVTF